MASINFTEKDKASLNLTEKDKAIISLMAKDIDYPYESFISYFEQNPSLLYDFKTNVKSNPRFYNRDVKRFKEQCYKGASQKEARGTSTPLSRKIDMRDRLREKLAQKKLTLNIKDSDVK